MTYVLLRKVSARSSQESLSEANNIFFQLAKLSLLVMLPVVGFLLTSYLHSMTSAIEKISDTQEKLSIMTARIDESVRHIDKRIERLEHQKP